MRFLSKLGESEDPLFKDVKPKDPKAIPPDQGDAGFKAINPDYHKDALNG